MNELWLDFFDVTPPKPTRGDCTDTLGYMEAHADAERRMARGEHQVLCQQCERWRWRLCAYAKKTTKKGEQE